MNVKNPKARSRNSLERDLEINREDGWVHKKLPHARSMADVLNNPPPPLTHMVPGIIAHAETTVVHVTKGVSVDLFAILLTYCCAIRKDLHPFGTGSGEPTLYCTGRTPERRTHEIMTLVFHRDPRKENQSKRSGNLFFSSRFHNDGSPVNLYSRTDQALFLERIPDGTKLVVFRDIEAWVASKSKLDNFDISSVSQFASELNSRGMAVLMFSHTTAKSSFDEFDDSAYHVRITPDPAGLTEIGSSFCLNRNKASESDEVPSRFRFWYSITDGWLEWGFELNTTPTPTEAKAIAMKERQFRVAAMLLRNMPQKEIAEVLGVDAATISRDVAKIKTTGSPTEPQAGENPQSENGAPQ